MLISYHIALISADAALIHLFHRTVFRKHQRRPSIYDHFQRRQAAVFFLVGIYKIIDLALVKFMRQRHSFSSQSEQFIAAGRIYDIQRVVSDKRIGFSVVIDSAVSSDQQLTFHFLIIVLVSPDDVFKIDFLNSAANAGVILLSGSYRSCKI